jgi:hypothetical protein
VQTDPIDHTSSGPLPHTLDRILSTAYSLFTTGAGGEYSNAVDQE